MITNDFSARNCGYQFIFVITNKTMGYALAMSDPSLRTQVYDSLRQALTTGRFVPGQKLTFRFIAGALGVSLTPVREALGRLVAEGAFEMQPSRSVRVPLMTRARIEELRDIRKSLEDWPRTRRRRPPTGSRSPSCAALPSPSPRRAAGRQCDGLPPTVPRVPLRSTALPGSRPCCGSSKGCGCRPGPT